MSAWPRTRLDECTEIVSGATPKTSDPSFWGGEIRWATPKDLSDLDGAYISDTPRKITTGGLKSCAASVLPAQSVLFSSRAPIGLVAVNTVPMATNQGFKSFVPDRRKIDPKYLYWWLRANRPVLEQLGNGATFKEMSKAAVSRVEIDLPPLPEQRRIAAILDKADALRAKRRAAIAKLDELTQSIFLDMFGDPATNPKGWPRVMLADVCRDANDIKCGPFGTQLSQSEYMAAGVPLWGIRHVNASFAVTTNEFLAANTAERLAAYSIVPGDIVMTRKGTVGNCAVYPRGMPLGIMHSDLLRLRVDGEKCDPTFVAHQLHTSRDVDRQIGAISGGAVMPGINVTKLKGLEIVLPPIREQRFFQARTATIAEHRSKTSRSCDLLNALFVSLQHRAFRGEL